MEEIGLDEKGDALKKKKKKKDKKDKKEKKEKKKDKKKKADDSDDDDEDAKKKKKDKKKEKKKKDKGDDDSDDGGEKKKKKEKKLKKDSKGSAPADKDGDDLSFDDELIQESILRLNKLSFNDDGKLTKNVETFFDETRMIQIQHAFSPKMRLYVVLEALFGATLTADGLKPRLPYITKMVSSPPMPASDILYGFEVYYVTNPGNLRMYPMVLKQLYDGDVVSEEALLAHYAQSSDSPGFDAALAAAKPFLEWMQEGGSDSDSDSGSGSDSDSD